MSGLRRHIQLGQPQPLRWLQRTTVAAGQIPQQLQHHHQRPHRVRLWFLSAVSRYLRLQYAETLQIHILHKSKCHRQRYEQLVHVSLRSSFYLC